MHIKAVIFDLGKVLVDFDYTIAARRIAARCTRSLSEVARFVGSTPLFIRYETGLLTSEQFYLEVCAATGYCGDFAEFAVSFGDIFTPIQPMVQLHAALRARGFPTYILSNTNELAVRHIRRNFPFFSEFDGHILSYEHQSMKPDARIYEVAERQSGCRGAELLYFDDLSENIAAAAARGWQAVLQQTPEISLAAVQRLGLLGPGTAAGNESGAEG